MALLWANLCPCATFSHWILWCECFGAFTGLPKWNHRANLRHPDTAWVLASCLLPCTWQAWDTPLTLTCWQPNTNETHASVSTHGLGCGLVFVVLSGFSFICNLNCYMFQEKRPYFQTMIFNPTRTFCSVHVLLFHTRIFLIAPFHCSLWPEFNMHLLIFLLLSKTLCKMQSV